MPRSSRWVGIWRDHEIEQMRGLRIDLEGIVFVEPVEVEELSHLMNV